MLSTTLPPVAGDHLDTAYLLMEDGVVCRGLADVAQPICDSPRKQEFPVPSNTSFTAFAKSKDGFYASAYNVYSSSSLLFKGQVLEKQVPGKIVALAYAGFIGAGGKEEVLYYALDYGAVFRTDKPGVNMVETSMSTASFSTGDTITLSVVPGLEGGVWIGKGNMAGFFSFGGKAGESLTLLPIFKIKSVCGMTNSSILVHYYNADNNYSHLQWYMLKNRDVLFANDLGQKVRIPETFSILSTTNESSSLWDFQRQNVVIVATPCGNSLLNHTTCNSCYNDQQDPSESCKTCTNRELVWPACTHPQTGNAKNTVIIVLCAASAAVILVYFLFRKKAPLAVEAVSLVVR